MSLDAVLTRYAVQLTARLSAVVLAAGLIVAARRLRGGHRGLWRTLDISAFGAFVAAHTVHFACLVLLARSTNGASIRGTGGWVPAMLVAALFYLGCGGAMRLKARQTAVWNTPGERRAEMLTLGALWLVFFQAYAGRLLDTPPFAFLALCLFYALVTFLLAAAKSPLERADSGTVQSV